MFGGVSAETMPSMDPIVVETASSATLGRLVDRLEGERVVYVGEAHTAYGDHLMQLEFLRGMAAQPGELAVGVEWIQARFQPVVDRYMAGEIDEAEFLRGTEYYDRWRFDYRLYRPIIEAVRERGIPLIALNASAELTEQIGKVGIDGLGEDLRSELPDGYDLGDKAYENVLQTIFDSHPSSGQQFQHFLEVQLTWDETMAQNVARYLDGGERRRMLVLAGKGHINGRSGIPNRVTRRTGIDGKTVATFSPNAGPFKSPDFIVLTEARSLPPAGVMRVLLDTSEQGVFVKDFVGESPAWEAGMRTKDRIVSIDGKPVQTYLDVKLAMFDKRPRDSVEVVIGRPKFFGGEKTRDLSFQLVTSRTAH